MANAVGYYNFKKIVDLLKQLQTYHEQLQGWGIGDLQQLIYYTEERLKVENTQQSYSPYYPLMWVLPEEATTDGRQTIYTFNILIMDVLNTKNNNIEVDIWSDTLDILKDVIAQLRYATGMPCYCNLDIDYPVQMLPFSESFDDYVSGWSGKIRLKVPDAIDRCDAPYATFPPCDNNSGQ